MQIKKFITNNVHLFVIAAILIAVFGIYKVAKMQKETTPSTAKETAAE